MTNEQALDLLSDFTDAAERAVREGVWASAFVQEGGEPTWDAVKSVANAAASLLSLSERVSELREDFEDIIP